MEFQPRPEVIIADPGVDDAVALLVASAIPGRNEHVATFGNATAERTSANYRGIRAFIDDHLKAPVVEGEVYLGAEKSTAPTMDFIHGANALEGLYQDFEPATTPSEVLYDSLTQHKRGVDVISLGALREVAVLLGRPDEDVRSLTVMGGAIHVQGNIAPRVEANIGGDPKALQNVLRIVRAKGIPMTIVPLDITQIPSLEFTSERVERLAEALVRRGSQNVADLLVRLVGPDATYTKFYQGKQGVYSNRPPFGLQKYKGAAMHDLTAILVKEHPELFTIVDMPIAGSKEGELLIPTNWMEKDLKKTATCSVVMDLKNPEAAEEYWRLTEKYLSHYS